MKINFLIFLFVILISLTFISDSFAEKKIKLRSGQTINIENLKFTLDGVDDSRCPSDVECVWGGQVTAKIRIENHTHSETIDFMPGDSYTFFSPYKIILLDLSPYPVSTEIPDEHIATLVMFSLDGKPPCEKYMTVKDGFCVPESPAPLDFRDSGSSMTTVYAYSSIGLVGVVLGFFVIKKWKNRK